MRTRDFAFVSLCYGRSGEEICTGYMPWPPAAKCNMITNKQTRHVSFSILIGRNSVAEWLIVASTYHLNSDPK